MGVGPGWDCGRCRLDGPNGLFLHCRVSMISMTQPCGASVLRMIMEEVLLPILRVIAGGKEIMMRLGEI